MRALTRVSVLVGVCVAASLSSCADGPTTPRLLAVGDTVAVSALAVSYAGQAMRVPITVTEE